MPPAALSPFQKEKLSYYFKFFDADGNGHLSMEDLPKFMERIREYTKWDENSVLGRRCQEIHENFFEVLFEKVGHAGEVSFKEWMQMWEQILPGCKGVANFPLWLRLLPQSLFSIIDRDGDDHVSEDELVRFYEMIVGLDPMEARTNGKQAYNQMTDFGRWPLNLDSYEQIFANFLIGQSPYGPGRHIFGCFEHEVVPFQLILPPPDDDDEGAPEMKESPRGSRRGSATGTSIPRPKVTLRI